VPYQYIKGAINDRNSIRDDIPSERREEWLTLPSIAREVEEIVAHNIHRIEPLNAPLRCESSGDQRSARGRGTEIVREPIVEVAASVLARDFKNYW
jgi:hypothetical protein